MSSSPRSCAVNFLVFLVLAFILGVRIFQSRTVSPDRTARVIAWLRDPMAHPEWVVKAGQRCNNAPFIMPTSGYIGFLWADSFRPGHQHQGLDIFGGESGNIVPVFAAYSGFLSRLSEWKSSLIVRIPDDPLHPGRQIWTYYTHMADQDGETFILPLFPLGVQEVFVDAGTLLGYQGNYSGDSYNPVGVHLHFSIVMDDGNGRFLNELDFHNTLDPSPYLGLPLDSNVNKDTIPVCQP